METRTIWIGVFASRIARILFVLPVAWGAAPSPQSNSPKSSKWRSRATEAQRQVPVAANMSLTKAEAAKFRPLYRQYRNEVETINDETIALMKEFAANYETLSDERAKSMANRWLAIQKQRLALKTKCMDRYAKAIGGAKMARVLQIENKLDALIEVNLARAVPLDPADG